MPDARGSRKGLIRNWFSASAQIANGAALSASVCNAGRPIVGLLMPTAWTSASLTFDVCACPNGTFFPLYGDNNTEVVITPTACTAIANNSKLEKLSSWYGFRIRSGSTVSDADNQGAARTFIVFMQG
jgi:hypothetical protein